MYCHLMGSLMASNFILSSLECPLNYMAFITKRCMFLIQ